MAISKSSLTGAALAGAILVAVYLSGAWHFGTNDAANTAQDLPQELRDEPDLYLQNATINQHHLNGVLKYELAAQTITHFDNQALTRLQRPYLVLHTLEGRSWEVTADRGYIRDQPTATGELEEVVFLRNNVELRQQLPAPQLLNITTSVLYLYPDRQFAETTEDVSIDTHTGRTKAAAMSSDLVTGVVNLESDTHQRVKTIVLPDQFK